MLHSKHIYVIVVPHICCSKNPTTCTCFFSLVYCTSGPMSSDMVSKFTVSQWDHTSSKVGYHDHVWTVSSQREYESQSTLNPRLYDNLVNRCGWRSSSHTSPLSETRHVSGCSLLKNISYWFMSDITCRFMCVFFLYSVSNSGWKPTARLFAQTGHECRRRCQLLQRDTVNR